MRRGIPLRAPPWTCSSSSSGCKRALMPANRPARYHPCRETQRSLTDHCRKDQYIDVHCSCVVSSVFSFSSPWVRLSPLHPNARMKSWWHRFAAPPSFSYCIPSLLLLFGGDRRSLVSSMFPSLVVYVSSCCRGIGISWCWYCFRVFCNNDFLFYFVVFPAGAWACITCSLALIHNVVLVQVHW